LVDALFARTQISFGIGAVEYRDSLLYVNAIYIASGVTDGGQRGELTPWQAKCKSGLPLNSCSISVLAFFWFSVGCCFCVFFGLFSGDLRFQFSHPDPDSP